MSAKFTAEMARTMTPEQVKEFWQQRQRETRAKGEPHYTHCVNPVTGRVLYTING
jgi:hypothetical protein